MSHKKLLQQELNQLSGPGIGADSPAVLALELAPGRLECKLTALDQLACAFEYLSYQTAALDNASLDELSHILRIYRRVHREDERETTRQAHGGKVAHRIVGQLLVERGIERVGAGIAEQ